MTTIRVSHGVGVGVEGRGFGDGGRWKDGEGDGVMGGRNVRDHNYIMIGKGIVIY